LGDQHLLHRAEMARTSPQQEPARDSAHSFWKRGSSGFRMFQQLAEQLPDEIVFGRVVDQPLFVIAVGDLVEAMCQAKTRTRIASHLMTSLANVLQVFFHRARRWRFSPRAGNVQTAVIVAAAGERFAPRLRA